MSVFDQAHISEKQLSAQNSCVAVQTASNRVTRFFFVSRSVVFLYLVLRSCVDWYLFKRYFKGIFLWLEFQFFLTLSFSISLLTKLTKVIAF